MNSSTHSTGSGSIFPGRGILSQQVEPYKHTDLHGEYTTDEVDSLLIGSKVQVWSEAAHDLNRLAHLDVNGHTTSDFAKGVAAKTGEVFDDILGAVSQGKNPDADLEAAKSVCGLLNQGLLIEVKNEVMAKKGMLTEYKKGEHAYAVGKKESAYSVETDNKGNFKIVEEELLQANELINEFTVDDEKPIFFKAKVIITGKTDALRERNIDKMDVKIAYTKEYPSRAAAKKANFTGIRAAGLADRKSLLS